MSGEPLQHVDHCKTLRVHIDDKLILRIILKLF